MLSSTKYLGALYQSETLGLYQYDNHIFTTLRYTQDIYYVETAKKICKIYQQKVIENLQNYLLLSFAPITSADIFNYRTMPLFTQDKIDILCILTDSNTRYCTSVERYSPKVYLIKVKTKSSTSTNICRRLKRTMQQEYDTAVQE